MVAQQDFKAGSRSWGLQLAQCHFHHILLVRSKSLGQPGFRWRNRVHPLKELLQSHIARGLDTRRRKIVAIFANRLLIYDCYTTRSNCNSTEWFRTSKMCDEGKTGSSEIVCICKWHNMFSFPKGSQTMPTNMPPPRKLPQRSWAASIPTILTHSALNILLLPSPTPGLVPGLAGSYLCSPLERFLGSVIMRRHLQRIIQQETVWVPSDLLSGDC